MEQGENGGCQFTKPWIVHLKLLLFDFCEDIQEQGVLLVVGMDVRIATE
jgi:hypothetical protein